MRHSSDALARAHYLLAFYGNLNEKGRKAFTKAVRDAAGEKKGNVEYLLTALAAYVTKQGGG